VSSALVRTRLIWTLVAAAAVCASAQPVAAAKPGPPVVAKADQHLWPDPISTQETFDRASRAAILVYVATLTEIQAMSDSDLQHTLQVEKMDGPSVQKWLARTWAASQRNYALASGGCGTEDWTCGAVTTTPDELRASSRERVSGMPAALESWHAAMEQFSLAYITEQLKLAAIFPRDNSEIDTFNDNEWNGDQLPDRQFYLTFDDGPTALHGNTDATLKMLSEEKKSAVFFLLGSNLKARTDKAGAAAMSALYGHQCVASHGWEHHSHARWDPWQDSVRLTQALISGSMDPSNALRLFRPPDGQRRPDSEPFFRGQKLQVALWNIDSLDWSRQLDASDVENRVVALMLVKRHGVILFHDIHPKAKTLLPTLFQETGTAVNWGDCHELRRD
jgi:peptidoglycan/xylan/chitin deacetylase (PgdA/CDA1 family)